jgi:hypothetical protein
MWLYPRSSDAGALALAAPHVISRKAAIKTGETGWRSFRMRELLRPAR